MLRALKLRRLVRSLEAERARIDKHIHGVTQVRAHAELIPDVRLVEISKFLQFILLNHRDIAQLVGDIIREQNPQRAGLYVRVLALVLFELFDDLEVLLNRDFGKHVESLFPDVVFCDHFRQTLREFNRFGNDSKDALKDVRNSVIAHREHDAARQLAALERLDQQGIVDLAMATKLRLASFLVLWGPVALMAFETGSRRRLKEAFLAMLDLYPNTAAGATPPETSRRKRPNSGKRRAE
jgi:hypothetical protein